MEVEAASQGYREPRVFGKKYGDVLGDKTIENS